MVDWYSAWWWFLYHLPPRGGLWVCKVLRGTDFITFPPHGGLRIYKALSGADLVFLTDFRYYSWLCLHILLAALLHWFCGVFIPIKIRILVGCLYIPVTPGISTSLSSLMWLCTCVFNLSGIGCHRPWLWRYAVYRVALILYRCRSLVATHRTADVRVTLDRPGTHYV